MMSDTFIPNKEDLHRMIRTFAGVHVEGQKDFIGPNKPDAPFFERVAAQETINDEDYIEMAERFYKYVNTQIPTIQHIAGYPPETDWQAALKALHEIGMAAKEARLKKEAEEAAHRKLHEAKVSAFQGLFNSDKVKWDKTKKEVYLDPEMLVKITSMMQEDVELYQPIMVEYIKGITNHYDRVVKNNTLHCERYQSVWYSKKDTSRRWPNYNKSISIKFSDKYNVGIPFYKSMKEIVDWKDFTWDIHEKVMKVNDNTASINRVIAGIDKLNWERDVPYIYDALTEMLEDAEDSSTPNEIDYTAKLFKGNIMIHLPYEAMDLRTIVKIHGRGKWNPDNKAWVVSLSLISDVKNEIENNIDSLENGQKLIDSFMGLDGVANFVNSKAERIHLSGSVTVDDGEIVRGMKERLDKIFPAGHVLYPFQYTGVRYAEISNGRCLIGDDMGIGKTIQALAYVALHPEHHPVLVVAPANVKFNWLKEAEKWVGSTYTSAVIRKGKDPMPNTDIVIINYDIVNKQKDALLAKGFKTIICDESHYLKNYKAARTKATIEIAQECDSVLFLSGTAMSNRPIELWTTLMTLRPNEWAGRWKDYTRRYCDAHHDGWGWKVDGSSNEEELNAKLRDLMIRRLKKEVMAELPDKIRQTHYVEPTDSEWKKYVNTQNAFMISLTGDNEGAKGSDVLVALTKLRHMCGLMKTRATVEYVNQYLMNNDRPIIVFTHHKDVLEQIHEAMLNQDRALRVGLITGSVKSEQRQVVVEQFQGGHLDVLLATTPAAKEGLTLTAADTVVFVEREWSPSHEEQAEDRVNRIGQDAETVWAVYLTVSGSIDEKFNNVIEEKRQVIKGILDGGEIGQRNAVVNELLKAMMADGNKQARDYFKERYE